jgi:two-component system phosphate regulon response regulator PhoB
MRVVLAEDDPSVRAIAKMALRRDGFDVTTANDGAEALRLVSEHLPDVALVDWMMPEVDGLDVCRQLKADARTCDIPVILFTARSQKAEIDTGLGLGVAGYITKPFDALTLGQQIRDILNRRGE